MKIGIVTFHCAYNFGSALQAYALKEYLVQRGHDVHIIDYRSANFDMYKLFRRQGLKSYVSDLLFMPGNIRRRRSYQTFWKEHLNLTEKTYQGDTAESDLQNDFADYDALICGSDQIWNLDCTFGPLPPFFLSFAPGHAKKIAYAPSLAHKHFEPRNFTAEDQERISNWLNRMDSVSVRELSVADQFKKLTHNEVVETLDPTLLLNLYDYKGIQSDTLPKGLKSGKYIFAYTLVPNPDMVKYLDKLAGQRNLTIVYYSRKPIHYTARSVNVWGIGPSEFLSLIDKADSVVSNSFHATVFSILYNKPFLTFGTEKSSSRMKTLLTKLGLDQRHLLAPDFKGTEGTMPFEPNLDVKKLDDMRKRSELFLKNSLE
ncbi:polysaccharide pyruvyl transferase family protein [Bifidobacterium pseudolongum]|uniref:polysaccharide pyruvyl transferase family protein n=1 Tax=Bifidobacterium pseudolongum TaxID=1694 RepID=UPI0010201876|nr:polysaccharide pyruvyl transferase family protein [Bifidobacterium pseudolongum]RYQ29139.1 Polysaccharide pyruvyl transferase [Bifidobacterium pseudolongum subsp. globosum]